MNYLIYRLQFNICSYDNIQICRWQSECRAGCRGGVLSATSEGIDSSFFSNSAPALLVGFFWGSFPRDMAFPRLFQYETLPPEKKIPIFSRIRLVVTPKGIIQLAGSSNLSISLKNNIQLPTLVERNWNGMFKERLEVWECVGPFTMLTKWSWPYLLILLDMR